MMLPVELWYIWGPLELSWAAPRWRKSICKVTRVCLASRQSSLVCALFTWEKLAKGWDLSLPVSTTSILYPETQISTPVLRAGKNVSVDTVQQRCVVVFDLTICARHYHHVLSSIVFICRLKHLLQSSNPPGQTPRRHPEINRPPL